MARKKVSKYRRSTPVERLLRNADHVVRAARLASSRLQSWLGSAPKGVELPKEVTAAVVLAAETDRVATDLLALIKRLDAAAYVPPRKSGVAVYFVEDRVKIRKERRRKYEIAFREKLAKHPDLLDDLVVDEVLPTRDLSVRGKDGLLFLVRKSHVQKLKVEEAEGAA